MRRHVMPRDSAVEALHSGENTLGIHIAGYYQNRVVGRIPGAVELLQHRSRGGVERCFGSQRIVRIGRAGEHVGIQPRDELVSCIGQVAGHFLLDRASFLCPLALRILRARQAGGVHVEHHVQILRRHGSEILGNGLLCVGVIHASQLGVEGRDLRAA